MAYGDLYNSSLPMSVFVYVNNIQTNAWCIRLVAYAPAALKQPSAS